MDFTTETIIEKTTTTHDQFCNMWVNFANNLNFVKQNVNVPIANNEKIIWHCDGSVIVVCDKVNNAIANNLYAIRSLDDPNRFFVGYIINDNSLDLLTGIIIYFNVDNKMTNKRIFRQIVCENNRRNRTIGKSNTFLFKQTLMFIQFDKNIGPLVLNVCCIEYYDCVLGSFSKYFDMIKYDHSMNDCNIHNYEQNGKFLMFNVIETSKQFSFQKICLLDMASTHVEHNNNLNFVKMNIYFCDHDKLDQFLELSSTFEETPYNDGYPLNCIKCNDITSEVTYHNKNSSMGFGNAFCERCLIRYSHSEKQWVCCKLIENSFREYYVCHKKINEHHDCNCNHRDKQYNIVTKQSEIKPYRKIGNIYLDEK